VFEVALTTLKVLSVLYYRCIDSLLFTLLLLHIYVLTFNSLTLMLSNR